MLGSNEEADVLTDAERAEAEALAEQMGLATAEQRLEVGAGENLKNLAAAARGDDPPGVAEAMAALVADIKAAREEAAANRPDDQLPG